MFKNRKIVIATKHKKECVISPILKKELGLIPFVENNLDTDIFGTFTGEIERTLNPIETARAKCIKAMELSGSDIAISNEGSFGAHPQLWIAKADFEIVFLVDRKNNLEFFAQEISTKTNFDGKFVDSLHQLLLFAMDVKFSSHGLILSNSKENKEETYKGICSWSVLMKKYKVLHEKYGQVYVETDMRAVYNPSRMQVIKNATKKLVKIIKTPCPQCLSPGFKINKAIPGLPCSLCGLPTLSTLKYEYACQACKFVQEEDFPNKLKVENPMYCARCNP